MRFYHGMNNPNFKHGLTKNPLYRTWSNAKSRCYDKNACFFEDYGGRGIIVCQEWKDDFCAFYDWAMANGYKQGLTLDRIDNNKGYSPDNCRWATVKEQSNNRRSNTLLKFHNETKTISQWADIVGICKETIYKRLTSGWSIERALTSPTRVYKKKHKQI